MELKKKIRLFAILSLVLAFAAGSAFAGGSAPGDRGAVQQGGDVVFFNYYDIRTMAQGGPGLTDNYFTVVNNDRDEWIQAHVRVRTGQCSVELLDFDVMLSPLDVFTFDLLQDAEGDTVFASCDTETLISSQFGVDANGCFVLDSGTFPAMTSLVQTCGQCPDGTAITAEAALEATRFGYVEILGEGELSPDDVGSGQCDGASPQCCESQLEDGEYNLFEWDDDSCSYESLDRNLFGKVYYAMFDASQSLVRVATENGYSDYAINDPIVHRPCYSDSSAGCSSGDGELEANNSTGWAYSAATTGADPEGANDLNWCFWNDTDTNPGDIVNQNGAGATFGPTFADFGGRGVSLTTTGSLVNQVNDGCDQRNAMGHYFAIPGLGETHYVFTFPLQHFINQTIAVSKDLRTDTEENECTLPIQKFISPGIPQPGVARGEVTIINADEGEPCEFNEGWIAFDIDVTDDGPNSCAGQGNCPSIGTDSVDDDACVFGTVANWGEAGTNAMATSPMQFQYWQSWSSNPE